jgi:predicted CoA-substrate-specific enzyme activase
MKKLGIDAGSAYLGAVLLNEEKVEKTAYVKHNGNIVETVKGIVTSPDFADFETIGLTGKLPGPRAADNILCYVEGAKKLMPEIRNIFIVGGETFSLVLFNGDGSYIEHSVNPPCASGTGAFIEQQAERISLNIRELSDVADSFSGKTPVIATRCAVFAKTDIIHAMQEGYSKEAVAAGLCEGISRSIADNLVKGRELYSPAGILGGVSLNPKVVRSLAEVLAIEIRVPEHSHLAGAIGAALLGSETLLAGASPEAVDRFFAGEAAAPREKRPPLPRQSGAAGRGADDFIYRLEEGVEIMLPRRGIDTSAGVYIGIDIGSTSTKAVLLSAKDEIAGGFYTKTGGAPIHAVKTCIHVLLRTLRPDPALLFGVGTTGSGRKLIKDLFEAELAVNEITAHARAASFLVPEADTIIEIGGQDSKFTRLKDGEVYFSKMNYVCAAGTGSFIEEQAKRLGVSLDRFSDMAYGTEAPFTSDRCTVYMERDLHALLGEGWSVNSLAAAVLHSVRDNYLAKVVERSPLGEKIVFQGATGRNAALVSSFEEQLGKNIHVSPYCHLTGAIGAALLCKSTEAPSRSSFAIDTESITFTEETCDRCANRCLLTTAEKNGRVTGWGMKCGKEYSDRGPVKAEGDIISQRFKAAMKPLTDPGGNGGRQQQTSAPVIAVPEVLYNAIYAPLWRSFLSSLGFTVQPPSEGRSALSEGKRIVNSDFCAPIIHAHGAFSECLQRGADFIFFPSMVNENNPGQEEHRFKKKTTDAFFCYYSQYLPSIMSKLTAVDVESRLISPLILFNSQTEEEITESLHAALHGQFPRVGLEQVREAFTENFGRFSAAKADWLGYYGKTTDPGRIEIALAGRPYIAMNRGLHLDIPAKLEALGTKVYWQDEFDLAGFNPAYSAKYLERMHWQFGKQILKLAEYAAQKPNLFIVFITSFRCSPDSFIISYLQDIMEHYGKPFLILQVDEHSSSVGYETRIEAGVTSFRTFFEKEGAPAPEKTEAATKARDDKLEPGDTVFIPYLDDCISSFWAGCFQNAGYKTVLLESRESDLLTGYKYTNGGECMPLTSLIGGVIERLRNMDTPPEKTFFYMPTVCMACNFPQYPILADLSFQRAGLGKTKIGLINNMSPGEILPQSLSIKMLESNIIGGILYKLYYRVHPYETEQGSTAAVFQKAKERISRAVINGEDLRSELAHSIDEFRAVSRDETKGRKPRIGLLGDLYVKFNSLINQNIQEVIDGLGGELVVPSLTEYPFHFYDADVRLYGDNPRHFKLLKTIEQRYEKAAEDLIGEQMEPDFAECVKLMEEYKIRHYIAGETSINIGRALYYIRHRLVDAIVHINPIFCCPGVVTSSIYRKMQEDFGVPIIDIFYDGTGKPNDVLIPHLHYLREKLLAD